MSRTNKTMNIAYLEKNPHLNAKLLSTSSKDVHFPTSSFSPLHVNQE